MRAPVAIALLACSAACARSTFIPAPPPDEDPQLGEVAARMKAAPPRELAPVAVGLTAEPTRLFAWDLRGKKLWDTPCKARSVPHVAGHLVVSEEDAGRVAMRDLQSGKVVHTIDDPSLRLIGGDGEAGIAIVALSTKAGADAYGSVVAIEGDKVLWEQAVGFQVGVPAVRAGMVFVPWATRALSIIDARTGAQLARVVSADDVLGQAFVDRGAVYIGHNRVYRLTPSFALGTKERAISFVPRARQLPGQPPLFDDVFEPPLPLDSARHRLRLVWRPRAPKGAVRFEDDNLYFQFHRFVFALDTESDGLHFAYSHPADIVGAAAQPRGLLIADAAGKLAFVNAATGQNTWEVDTGLGPLHVVRFRAEDHSPGRPSTEAALPVHEQLIRMARDPDARLLRARVLAIELLEPLQHDEITGRVLRLCEEREAPAQVRQAACQVLASRQVGESHVFGALTFTPGGPPPPLAPLARAAVGMRLKTAVPLLLAWLEDPRTPEADLPDLVAALEALGDRATAEPIEAFLRLYHAEPYSPALASALGRAILAVSALKGPAAKPALDRIFEDPMTMETVRGFASEALVLLPRNEREARDARRESQGAEPKAAELPAVVEVASHLTAGMTARALRPARPEIEACLTRDPGKPRSARLEIDVAPDGRVLGVAVAPASLGACMAPLVRGLRFPATKATLPQVVTFVMSPER